METAESGWGGEKSILGGHALRRTHTAAIDDRCVCLLSPSVVGVVDAPDDV